MNYITLTVVSVCQLFFWPQTSGQPSVLWEITSEIGPLEPNTVGYRNNLVFIEGTKLCKLFKAQNTASEAGAPRQVPHWREEPQKQFRVICMDNGLLWFRLLFIATGFYEETKAARWFTTLTCRTSSQSLLAIPPLCWANQLGGAFRGYGRAPGRIREGFLSLLLLTSLSKSIVLQALPTAWQTLCREPQQLK